MEEQWDVCWCSPWSQPAPAALWEGTGSQTGTTPETLVPRKNPSQIPRGSMQVWETQQSPSRGSCKGQGCSSSSPALLTGKGCQAHGSFLHVPKIPLLHSCFGKRWHQSKLKCSAKISFFFPNKPRTCSNSRGTSTAFFCTSLSKSYKIKTRKYCQPSVQALHSSNPAHSKVLKDSANKHLKKKPALSPLLLVLCYLTDHFPGLPWLCVTQSV